MSSRLLTIGADATHHLWVQFLEGQWAWVDLADFAERNAGISSPDTFMEARLSADGLQVEWPDGTSLPARVLNQPEGVLTPEGVYIRARGANPQFWYRPLVVEGLVEADAPDQEVKSLADALSPHPINAVELVARYHVDAALVIRRVLDLVTYLEQRQGGRLSSRVGHLFHSAWAPGRRSQDPALRTPLLAIQQGRLALVEHIYTSRG